VQADHFRELFRYHSHLNQKIWETAVSHLEDPQFTQELSYSVGSIRNQVVHMLETDLRWFNGLAGQPPPAYSDPEIYTDKAQITALSQKVEALISEFLETLEDSNLDQPFGSPPSEHKVWQVLFHVLAHGIDHRAQILAMLAQMGIVTFPQDYAIYLFGRI